MLEAELPWAMPSFEKVMDEALLRPSSSFASSTSRHLLPGSTSRSPFTLFTSRYTAHPSSTKPNTPLPTTEPIFKLVYTATKTIRDLGLSEHFHPRLV